MAVVSVLSFVAAAVLAVGVRAESHLFKFQNNCGRGTPQLIQGTKVLSNGEDYTHNGIFSGIAYLQTGECGFNADDCSLLEMTLVNPTVPGGGSSTDISLIDPHKFNVPMAFSYINGCDGQGKSCLTADCRTTAFFQPTDYFAQVQCEEDNVGLLVTFCPNGLGTVGGSSHSSSPSSSVKTTTNEVHTTSTVAQHTASTVSPTTSTVLPTTSTVSPTTSTVSHTSTSKTAVAPPSSSAMSTAESSSFKAASTIIATTTVAASSVTSTIILVASATSSSPVNRKQCKPGQKARRKRDATKRAGDIKHDSDIIKREALAHHRRGHGHH